MQVIYIDVLFFINFIMDFMIFWVSGNLLNKRYLKRKLCIGSIIAALLYCLIVYIPLLQKLPYYIYYLFIPSIPILYMFEPVSLKEFLKDFLVCTISAFLIGGVTFNLYYLINQGRVLQDINFILPVSGGILICIIIILSFKWIRQRIILPQFEYDITLYNLEKEEKLIGIMDTGNCLYTLLGHRPVTVVTYDCIEKLLTSRDKELLKQCRDRGIVQTLSEVKVLDNSLYIIPFKSIGCKEGMMVGVEIEQVLITRGRYQREFEKCIIGVALDSIFREWKYEVLVHPDFIIN